MRSTFLLGLALLFACRPKVSVTTEDMEPGTGSLLQAISFVDENVIWVSGHEATFGRSLDGGQTWEFFHHPIDSLQFRDIHGLDEDHAILMSAGPGALSAIFQFDVDGQTITKTYGMPHQEGFLNTIEFWDHKAGVAFGDSFNGQLFILKTEDGGQSWRRINPEKLPSAGQGEGGFAASGTCISTYPGGLAWIGTGASGNSRVLKTTDFGETWKEISDGPLVKGEMAGIFSICMMDESHGAMVGGDLATPDQHTANTAVTRDGGMTWETTNHPMTRGCLYGSSFIQYKESTLWFACGPSGLDYSGDGGGTWTNLDSANYWAVNVHESGTGLATGKEGKILRIQIN